jgi:3-hydroxyisobutyrate dehydrogenase-like beta-hydroxyacid dehydrogenase
VVVYDVRREAAASLVSAGAACAESPRAAATGCAIVATCLPGPVEMERVTLGPDGILDSIAPGAVYVDHTTNAPALVRTIHDRFGAKGVAMLDAPVSGGAEGAATRDLLIMVGGEHGVFERVRPLLDTMAKRVLYTGQIGCGSISKLMHNAASFTLDLLMAECWTVKAGVAPETIVEVFRAPLSVMMSLKAPARARRTCAATRAALALRWPEGGLAPRWARRGRPHAALRPVRAGADRRDGARGRPRRVDLSRCRRARGVTVRVS